MKNSCLLIVAILFVSLGLTSCEKIQEDFQSKHYLRCEIKGEKFEKVDFLPPINFGPPIGMNARYDYMDNDSIYFTFSQFCSPVDKTSQEPEFLVRVCLPATEPIVVGKRYYVKSEPTQGKNPPLFELTSWEEVPLEQHESFNVTEIKTKESFGEGYIEFVRLDLDVTKPDNGHVYAKFEYEVPSPLHENNSTMWKVKGEFQTGVSKDKNRAMHDFVRGWEYTYVEGGKEYTTEYYFSYNGAFPGNKFWTTYENGEKIRVAEALSFKSDNLLFDEVLVTMQTHQEYWKVMRLSSSEMEIKIKDENTGLYGETIALKSIKENK